MPQSASVPTTISLGSSGFVIGKIESWSIRDHEVPANVYELPAKEYTIGSTSFVASIGPMPVRSVALK